MSIGVALILAGACVLIVAMFCVTVLVVNRRYSR